MPLFQDFLAIFLDNLYFLAENSQYFLLIFDLLIALFESLQFPKKVLINISQLVFFLEAVLHKNLMKLIKKLEKTHVFLEKLGLLLEKIGLLYVFQPITLSQYDLLSQNNLWKDSEAQYKEKTLIFKEGGILVAFFNILADFLEFCLENSEENAISGLMTLDRVFSENLEKSLENSNKIYLEIFSDLALTIPRNEGNKETIGKKPGFKLFLLVNLLIFSTNYFSNIFF